MVVDKEQLVELVLVVVVAQVALVVIQVLLMVVLEDHTLSQMEQLQ
jgi:hypothetical protein